MRKGETNPNGSGNFEVHQHDMSGWVRIFPEPGTPLPEDLGYYLSQTLTEWFRQRPHLRLRCVVPVSRDGDTVELHAWYEVHVFPTLQTPESG